MISDGTIFVIGIIAAAAAVVLGAVIFGIYAAHMKRLKKTLDSEYGERPSAKTKGKRAV